MDSSKTKNAGKFVILHHLQTKKVVNEPVGTSSYIYFSLLLQTGGGGGGGGGRGGEGERQHLCLPVCFSVDSSLYKSGLL